MKTAEQGNSIPVWDGIVWQQLGERKRNSPEIFSVPEDEQQEGAVVKLLTSLVHDAASAGASDIHIEPFENETMVRMRLNGVLRPFTRLTGEVHPRLIRRIKILAELNIAECRLPQDGHFRVWPEEKNKGCVNIRASIVPTVFGEKAVLRLLTNALVTDNAGSFSMDSESYARFRPLLDSANGLIYVTGPTGSGKSTTLYLILKYLARRDVNIITVEDPIEKNIPGVNQMQVAPGIGLTFETGLRAILRQDPDIIMVGETRDSETANMSIRAAMTGHMVFSTLHARNAVSGIERMAELGVERSLFGETVSCLTAQRLVRTVCPFCAAEVPALPEEERMLGGKYRVRRSTGCAQCGGTGYAGRIAVHEILVVDRTVRRMILNGTVSEEIEEYVRTEQGMKTIREKGLELVREGITTMEEVRKHCFDFENR